MPAKPTARQAKAMELIRKGKSPVQAMREAGYSESTSQAPGRRLIRSVGAQTLLEQYRSEYDRLGIKPTYYVQKVKDLIEAEKVHSSHTEPDRLVPDWQARAKGLEIFRKDAGLDLEQQPTSTTNILVIPGELLSKYGVTPDSETRSS